MVRCDHEYVIIILSDVSENIKTRIYEKTNANPIDLSRHTDDVCVCLGRRVARHYARRRFDPSDLCVGQDRGHELNEKVSGTRVLRHVFRLFEIDLNQVFGTRAKTDARLCLCVDRRTAGL